MRRITLNIKRHLKLKEVIKLRYRKLSNGNLSLYLDCYSQGKRVYQFLHLYIIPEIDENCKRQNAETLKQALLIKSQKIIEFLKAPPQEAHKRKEPEISLLNFVQQYADDRKKPNVERYHGRYSTIITLKRHLEKFGVQDTLISQVDVNFIKRFIDYLRSARDLRQQEDGTRKLSEGTIFLKYCILRSVLIEAKKQKLIAENPFTLLPSNYKLKRPDSSRCYLNKKELAKVIEEPCAYSQLKEAFLFSCFTGLRKSDILELKWEDIIKENNKSYVNKKIKKTQRWLKIPLSSQAQQWLPPRPHSAQGIVFDTLSHSAMSKNLKTWLAQIKTLRKDVTFHCFSHNRIFY